MDGFTLLATVENEEDIEKFLHPKPEIIECFQGPETKTSEPTILKIKAKGRPKKELSQSLASVDIKIPFGASVPWFDNKVEFVPKDFSTIRKGKD